jgi:hypothetical protein
MVAYCHHNLIEHLPPNFGMSHFTTTKAQVEFHFVAGQ